MILRVRVNLFENDTSSTYLEHPQTPPYQSVLRLARHLTDNVAYHLHFLNLFCLLYRFLSPTISKFIFFQVPENDSNGDLESNRRSIVISKPFLQKHQSNPLHVLDSQLDAILDNHGESLFDIIPRFSFNLATYLIRYATLSNSFLHKIHFF